MNQQIKKAIIDAYNDSKKNRKKFEKILFTLTGLKKSGMQRGSIGEFISTLIFKEYDMGSLTLRKALNESKKTDDAAEKYDKARKARIAKGNFISDKEKAQHTKVQSYLAKRDKAMNTLLKKYKVKNMSDLDGDKATKFRKELSKATGRL